VHCWGFNQRYQLGDGTYGTKREPVPISSELTFKAVSAGTDHTCAVATDGAAYCWGNNTYGQIGNGSPRGGSPHTRWEAGVAVMTPTPVAGAFFRTGTAPGGEATFEHLGIVSFKSISAGVNYTCGISTDGAAHCWGNGGQGKLGHGSQAGWAAPIPVADWR
jgi:alpha-tubulin suppressor-like RCC1 family protein